MEFAFFNGNMDTLDEILYDDDRINLNVPTGKLLVQKDLAISYNFYIPENSNLINNIK